MTQQWLCLNLTRNSFYILFPAKDIMSYKQIISSCLYFEKMCMMGVTRKDRTKLLFSMRRS